MCTADLLQTWTGLKYIRTNQCSRKWNRLIWLVSEKRLGSKIGPLIWFLVDMLPLSASSGENHKSTNFQERYKGGQYKLIFDFSTKVDQKYIFYTRKRLNYYVYFSTQLSSVISHFIYDIKSVINNTRSPFEQLLKREEIKILNKVPKHMHWVKFAAISLNL